MTCQCIKTHKPTSRAAYPVPSFGRSFRSAGDWNALCLYSNVV